MISSRLIRIFERSWCPRTPRQARKRTGTKAGRRENRHRAQDELIKTGRLRQADLAHLEKLGAALLAQLARHDGLEVLQG